MTLVNQTISQYRIVSQIGAGGMGEVYRARDTQLGRDVAIKVLPAAFSENSERLRRFEQEAQAAGALSHPNILVIYHIGTHEGAPYIVSELLEGETLRERLAGTALPQRKAIDYALQISRHLISLRQIKPSHQRLNVSCDIVWKRILPSDFIQRAIWRLRLRACREARSVRVKRPRCQPLPLRWKGRPESHD
jgi:serine/threonine protein kinase